MKTELKLSLKLKRHLINNKISPVFINFEKSLIEETKDYQILLLEKPNSVAFEIEALEWTYPSEKVLLIYDVGSEKISVFPLEFSFKLAGRKVEDEFNFCNYHALKICEQHILITVIGQDLDSNHSCLDIVLLTPDGNIISVWKAENCNAYKNNISDFHQLQPGHWIANLTFDQREQNKPLVHWLCLLSLNHNFAHSLSLGGKYLPNTGTLLASNTNEISSWFSPEINNMSNFFVLASHYQCCIYRFDKQHHRYDKIADIILERSFFSNISKVILSDDGIIVILNDGRSLVQSCSFHFSFKN